MGREELLKGFEFMLIELEYAIADYQCENADNKMGTDADICAQTDFKLSAVRCAVEVGLEVLSTIPHTKAEVVSNILRYRECRSLALQCTTRHRIVATSRRADPAERRMACAAQAQTAACAGRLQSLDSRPRQEPSITF